MILRKIPIAQIKPAAYNPRKDLKPGDPAYDQLDKAVEAFGLVQPLVWNERTGNLVAGHQRLKIIAARGETDVDVSVVDLDDAQEKALNLALNKISGEWEFSRLADLLQDIDTGDFDLDVTGFDEIEREKLATWTAPEDKPNNVAVDIKEQYLVMVECASESEQRHLLERFTSENLKCRALIS